MKRELYIKELKETEYLLSNAIAALEYSYIKVKRIELDNEPDLEKLETFESFTSRFARLSDIYTQKYLKTFFLLIDHKAATLIDKANALEKLDVIYKANTLLDIRRLRNELIHEYIAEELNAIFVEVIKYTEPLIKIVHNTIIYSSSNIY